MQYLSLDNIQLSVSEVLQHLCGAVHVAIKELRWYKARFLGRGSAKIPVRPAFGTIISLPNQNAVPSSEGHRFRKFADM
ncbi:hypothetical protein A2T76_18325 [Pseudomonas brenneri]|nr:hypothetical protein A2T76_18325 [Pseudomonas brenneri]